MSKIESDEVLQEFFYKTTNSLIRFRVEIENVTENGDLAHDKYLRDLKKVIDDELVKQKPSVLNVMEFIVNNKNTEYLLIRDP